MATADDVLGLLVPRIVRVLAIDPGRVSADARFDEDLHADSLDLVEVVEGVERDLQERGERAELTDEELLALRTVGEAAERIAESTTAAGDAEAR